MNVSNAKAASQRLASQQMAAKGRSRHLDEGREGVVRCGYEMKQAVSRKLSLATGKARFDPGLRLILGQAIANSSSLSLDVSNGQVGRN